MTDASRAPSARQQLEGYVDLHYGHRSGYAVLGLRRVLEDPFRFGSFGERFYPWPAERSTLCRDALAAATTDDVFIAPLLRDSATRKIDRSAPLAGSLVWLDVDGWTNDLEQALAELALPCHLVDSGGLGQRRHVYVDVGQLLPGEEIAGLADQLARVLGTDTAGGNNKYLRPPGTLNHKPCKDGQPPGEVRWLPTLHPAAEANADRLRQFLASRQVRPRHVDLGQTVRRSDTGKPSTLVADLERSFSRNGSLPCPVVLDLADAFRKALVRGPRHEALLAPLARLRRAGAQGHPGVVTVAAELRQEFIEAVRGARLNDRVAGQEFDRALVGPGLSAVPHEAPRAHPICSCEVTALRHSLNDAKGFTSRSRATERRVLQSLIREAERTGSRQVSKSTRQIVEDAGCNRRTVNKALTALQSSGRIEAVLSRGTQTTTMVLASALASAAPGSPPPSPAGIEIGAHLGVGPTHPVFGVSGLGGGAQMTFDALDELRLPVRRGALIAIRKGQGPLLGRRRRWRTISPRSGRGGRTAARSRSSPSRRCPPCGDICVRCGARSWSPSSADAGIGLTRTPSGG